MRELRQSKGLTLEQLAKELGLVKQTVGHWETGIRVPSLEIAAVIADYFNVSLDYLIGRSNDPILHQPVIVPEPVEDTRSQETYNHDDLLAEIMDKKYDKEYLCQLLESNLVVLTNRERKPLTPEQKEGFLNYLKTGQHPELYDPDELNAKDSKAAHQEGTHGLKREGLTPELLMLMNITKRINKVLIKYLDSEPKTNHKDEINDGLLK